MSKHWDYEDDHDWDDTYDYAANGYVYWYGKYYPKEEIDALFKDSSNKNDEVEGSGTGWLLLILAGLGFTGIGIEFKKKVIPAIKKKLQSKSEK